MSDLRSYRPDSFPPIVKNLIIINVLVYIAQTVLDPRGLTNYLMLWPVQHPEFAPYQIATHMFSHAPLPMIFHIAFNMFGLWMFGRVLENVWGPKRFLLFYILCGVGAAFLHLGIQYFRWEQAEQLYASGSIEEAQTIVSRLGPALGASGAIMGIFAAFAYLFPNTEMFIMFIPFPIKAKWAVLGMAAYDIFGGVAKFSGDNIAHFAHLGGAITGFIIVLIWNKLDKKRFY
jgi:membrane associated rhomboid family serine protease